MATVRQPLCLYYSSDPSQLTAEVTTAFQALHRVRPNQATSSGVDRPESASERSETDSRALLGLLVPHGAACDGFLVAAHAYDRLAAHLRRARCTHLTAVLLGTEHRATTPIALSRLDWRTPLGVVPTDTAAVDWLQQQHSIPVAEAPHASEHSIENQLPFLQFAAARSWDLSNPDSCSSVAAGLSIVPISVGCLGQTPGPLIQQHGNALAQLLHHQEQRPGTSEQAVLIVTSDFTHAGPWYRELPPPGVSLANYMTQQDAPLLRAIQRGSVDELLSAAAATRNSLCGLHPLAVALAALYGGSGSSGGGGLLVADLPELLTYQPAHLIFKRPDSTGFAAFAMHAKQ